MFRLAEVPLGIGEERVPRHLDQAAEGVGGGDRFAGQQDPVGRLLLGRRRHALQGHRDRLQAAVAAGLPHALVKVRRRRLVEGQLADAKVEGQPHGAPVAGAVVARHGDVAARLLVELGPPALMEGHRRLELKLLEIRPQLAAFGPAAEGIAARGVLRPQVGGVVERREVGDAGLGELLRGCISLEPIAKARDAVAAEAAAPEDGEHVLLGLVALDHVGTGGDDGQRGPHVARRKFRVVRTAPGIWPGPVTHPVRHQPLGVEPDHVPFDGRSLAHIGAGREGSAVFDAEGVHLLNELGLVAVGPFEPRGVKSADGRERVVRIPLVRWVSDQRPHADGARAGEARPRGQCVGHLVHASRGWRRFIAPAGKRRSDREHETDGKQGRTHGEKPKERWAGRGG